MQYDRALPVGTLIAGNWRIERVLGAGGFGITYGARSRSGEYAALKEYVPSGLCTRLSRSTVVIPAQGPAGDMFQRGMTSFMREAETLGRLEHPSIVHVKENFEVNGTAYMALDYIEGGSLGQFLKRLGRPPTQEELDRILWPLVDALIQVHSLPLLHRDLKPDNIMLQHDGTPVLIDFGAVKALVANDTRTIGASTLNFVTDGYAPPEQYVPDGGHLLGPWTDIYALGATIYEALTGSRPPPSQMRQIDDTLEPLSDRGGAGRPSFFRAVDRSLALRRQDRPQSMIELRRAMGLKAPVAAATEIPEVVLTAKPRKQLPVAPSPAHEQLLGANLASQGSVVDLQDSRKEDASIGSISARHRRLISIAAFSSLAAVVSIAAAAAWTYLVLFLGAKPPL